ncbi:hypothetical protein QE364_003898 [Nocardioides zeae]|uniref:Uncharacterized protein n=1 Tax=Nocardioides zeae TaxID=1457234 RepID=A0ACC6INR9_9ACTN|nr:hypothetical protein [Nocardioides zeae]MDR6212167.1 hypothetical protein [Nocardioides zeae]
MRSSDDVGRDASSGSGRRVVEDLHDASPSADRDASCVDARRVVPAGATGEASSLEERRVCAWCKGPIPAAARRDALCCSKRCRQARHRFVTGVGVGTVAGGQPRRLAYADPPYPGLSARYYGDHPDFAGEVDHAALVEQLVAGYDAWALSTSARALPAVLALCPPGVQVAAWFRGERDNKAAQGPLNGWEPVIYAGAIRRAGISDASRPPAGATPGQHDASGHAGATRRVDALVHVARPRTTDPARVVGAKPAAFCRWVFDLLGAQPGDEFTDVFPGSGGVARAWDVFTGA